MKDTENLGSDQHHIVSQGLKLSHIRFLYLKLIAAVVVKGNPSFSQAPIGGDLTRLDFFMEKCLSDSHCLQKIMIHVCTNIHIELFLYYYTIGEE